MTGRVLCAALVLAASRSLPWPGATFLRTAPPPTKSPPGLLPAVQRVAQRRPSDRPLLEGCFIDHLDRDLPQAQGSASLAGCAILCEAFPYFGIQSVDGESSCFCGHAFGKWGSSQSCQCDGALPPSGANCVYQQAAIVPREECKTLGNLLMLIEQQHFSGEGLHDRAVRLVARTFQFNDEQLNFVENMNDDKLLDVLVANARRFGVDCKLDTMGMYSKLDTNKDGRVDLEEMYWFAKAGQALQGVPYQWMVQHFHDFDEDSDQHWDLWEFAKALKDFTHYDNSADVQP